MFGTESPWERLRARLEMFGTESPYAMLRARLEMFRTKSPWARLRARLEMLGTESPWARLRARLEMFGTESLWARLRAHLEMFEKSRALCNLLSSREIFLRIDVDSSAHQALGKVTRGLAVSHRAQSTKRHNELSHSLGRSIIVLSSSGGAAPADSVAMFQCRFDRDDPSVGRGILSASKGVKDMNKAWLAEAGLSPAPRVYECSSGKLMNRVEWDVLSLTEATTLLEAELKAERPKAVAAYKASLGFESGLEKMGRFIYKFRYRVALERLRGKHPEIAIEQDPFVECPYDVNVEIDLN
ncbi:hypothetical protein BHM03_00032656 [Ensete ventricosum]|nr:hypothetical protein BHM03_00032656 [Ensete ventricosum]